MKDLGFHLFSKEMRFLYPDWLIIRDFYVNLPCLSGLIHVFIRNTKTGNISDMTKS